MGEKLTLRIGDIAFGGEGVARVEDFVVFVPFTALNEVDRRVSWRVITKIDVVE